jgi:hypothetical protein
VASMVCFKQQQQGSSTVITSSGDEGGFKAHLGFRCIIVSHAISSKVCKLTDCNFCIAGGTAICHCC